MTDETTDAIDLDPSTDHTLVIHRRTDHVYEMVGIAHMVFGGDEMIHAIHDLATMMVYRDPDTQALWIRPIDDFMGFDEPDVAGERRERKFEDAESHINRLLDATRGVNP